MFQGGLFLDQPWPKVVRVVCQTPISIGNWTIGTRRSDGPFPRYAHVHHFSPTENRHEGRWSSIGLRSASRKSKYLNQLEILLWELWRKFCQKKKMRQWISVISKLCTVWKNKKFSLLAEKIFRQINSLVTYLVKPLFSRNFCQICVRENSHNFHSVHTYHYITVQCGGNYMNSL